ncbi:MAG: hypothetical protein R3F65_27790 [bacterium]
MRRWLACMALMLVACDAPPLDGGAVPVGGACSRDAVCGPGARCHPERQVCLRWAVVPCDAVADAGEACVEVVRWVDADGTTLEYVVR